MTNKEPSKSRRQFLYSAFLGLTGVGTLQNQERLKDTVQPDKFTIIDTSIGGDKLVPGDELYVFSKIKNIHNSTANATVELVIDFNTTKQVVETTTLHDIPVGETALAEFRWKIPETANNSWVNFETRVRESGDLFVHDTTKDTPKIGVTDEYGPIDTWGARAEWAAYNGLIQGEWGVKHRIQDSDSAAYLFGWLSGSTVPIVDAAADIRDCRVKTDHGVFDHLDCSGMVVSVTTSAGTVTGALSTAVSGPIGISIAGLSAKIDQVENVTDYVSILGRFLKYHPEKTDTVVNVISGTVLGKWYRTFLNRIPEQLQPSHARKLIRSLKYRRSYDVYWTDHPVILRADELKPLKNRDKPLGHFDEGITAKEIDWVMGDYTRSHHYIHPGTSVEVSYLHRKVPDTDEVVYVRIKDTTKDPDATESLLIIDGARQIPIERFEEMIGKRISD